MRPDAAASLVVGSTEWQHERLRTLTGARDIELLVEIGMWELDGIMRVTTELAGDPAPSVTKAIIYGYRRRAEARR